MVNIFSIFIRFVDAYHVGPEKSIAVDPHPDSRPRPHLEQQGGFEKLQKAQLSKLGD